MLPGLRFLLAAIVLCISILVFGLGAAALLRAAHEEFAQNPSWRATPEPRFAQSEEPAKPVLAMLRVEPPETKTVSEVPARAAPVIEAPATAPGAADEEKAAAPPAPEMSPPPIETATTETPPAPISASAETAPASTAPATDNHAAADTKIAAVEQAAPAPARPATAAQVVTPAATTPEGDPAAAKIATLGGPPVAIAPDQQAKKATAAEEDREEAKKRARAERAKERRKQAARRARLASQQATAPLAAPDLFAQQTPATQQPVAMRRTR
jgi:hypothetical protein